MEEIYCSAADTAMECSGSLLPVKYPYNPGYAVGNEGTAAHKGIEQIIETHPESVAEVAEPLAVRYGVDLDSLTFLLQEAWRAWGKLSHLFRSPQLERSVKGPYCRGRADLVSYGVDGVAALDWKFGYIDTWHPHQLTAYASCLRAEVGMPSRGYIDVVEVQVRAGKWWHRKLDGDTLDEWESQLARNLRHPGRQWAPGTDTCRYCASRIECPARAQYIASAAAWMGGFAELGEPREAIAEGYEQAEALRAALRLYDAAVHDRLRDGPLDLPGDRRAELVETKRDEIDTGKAWPVLAERMKWDPKDVLPLTTIGKGKL